MDASRRKAVEEDGAVVKRRPEGKQRMPCGKALDWSSRSLIALGVLATFAGAACAQSSITLYGTVDTNLEFDTNFKNPSGGPDNRFALNGEGLSGSRWGLRGVEDLGGGLSGVFVLESGFGGDDGTSQQGGRLFGRQAFIGLQSATYGKLTFGRQYTSMLEALANFSPAAMSSLYEPVIAQIGPVYREDNTAKYSATFGPISVGAHWSFGTGGSSGTVNGSSLGGKGEVPGQFRRDTGYGARASYTAGPFGTALTYDQVNPSIISNGTFLGTGTFKKAAAAVSYAVGPAIFMGGYRWARSSAPGQTLVRDNLYWAGVYYEVTPALSLTLDYYYQVFRSSTLPALKPPGNPRQLMFIADYRLSRRTDLYLTTAYSKNAGLCLDTASIAFTNGYQLGGGKNSMFGAALGIRHHF
ncbi:porin [Cupriavidus sp. NPDC089707]|uniref:porin n=1 Tax=Cupriavidus sp. NPDC089707 TaxID=3363963 RepID=UPI003808FD42